MSILKAAGPSFVLLLAVLVPFLGTAYTIDDTLFLRQAEHLTVDPWHPTAFDVVWTEKPAPLRMSEIMVSGPTMAYLLVPTMLAGGAEWVAHMTQIVVFALALIATASLGLRLGLTTRAAATAALLLAATPAALAMARSAMPDIPAMAFGVIGLERLLAWRDEGRWPAGLMSAIGFALAMLARSHLLALLPIGGLLLIVGRLPETPSRARNSRPRPRPPGRSWVPLAAAPLLAVAASFVVRDPDGPSSVIDATLRYSGADALGSNAVAFATHWALALPLALPWAAIHWRRLVRSPALYIVTIAIACFLFAEQPPWRMALIAIAGGLSAAVLLDVLVDARNRKDSLQFALGLTLFAALPVGFYQHLPSKYLLASAPCAAILIARMLDRQTAPAAQRVVAATLALGILLGVSIMRADAAFAGLGRRAAQELIAVEVGRGPTVWFAGHWGFQWYAERAGAKALTLHGAAPRPGDLAVSSQNALGGIIEVFQPRTLVAVISDERPGGRVMSRTGGAGFYSNAWGYLPWAWSDDVLDRYTLWRLQSTGTPAR